MRRHRFVRKTLMSVAVLATGGALLQSTCINTIASLPICGAVLTFCTPTDQLNALFPLLEIPDFDADPSCTIPLGCGGGDVFQDPPDNFPGGEEPEEPPDDQGGGAGGGGAGGGGGGAGGGGGI